ncbi:hypothetical protein [Paenibacillus aceris]|uniref:Uncharacterized protein n=1 Tax=Paenibacillus aceris TaxID=869555 RepID=A0ABS4I2T3_9BACL|nr:hypothetical protein [Paenibacillus aceris]MBP1965192.1 hypothetical protein [Paenibacillus aceris]NHW33170.1 hypothetical protein [Paenibacillus aceris]
MKKNNAIALAIMFLFGAGIVCTWSSLDWGNESPTVNIKSNGYAQGKSLYGFIFYEETASNFIQIK